MKVCLRGVREKIHGQGETIRKENTSGKKRKAKKRSIMASAAKAHSKRTR